MQELIKAMDVLADLHGELLTVSSAKREVLVRNEVDQLNQIVSREGKLIRLIGEADQQRIKAMSDYLLRRGYHYDSRITVSNLIKLVFKSEEKQQLLQAHQRLVAILAELKKVNELNNQLIQQSLSFIDYTLDLFTGASTEEATYTNPMKNRSNGSKGLGYFDARA